MKYNSLMSNADLFNLQSRLAGDSNLSLGTKQYVEELRSLENQL